MSRLRKLTLSTMNLIICPNYQGYVILYESQYYWDMMITSHNALNFCFKSGKQNQIVIYISTSKFKELSRKLAKRLISKARMLCPR